MQVRYSKTHHFVRSWIVRLQKLAPAEGLVQTEGLRVKATIEPLKKVSAPKPKMVFVGKGKAFFSVFIGEERNILL